MNNEPYCPGCGTIGEGAECAPDCERAPKERIEEPRNYTLPQQFIQDREVPTRWRVWGVINGFFIGGQYCWASNEWIAERVNSHKDTVSQAVKELESAGIIRCERGARSRSIYPMIGANAYQWSASTPISGRHRRLSNSYSNGGKRIPGALEDEQREEIVETSEVSEETRVKKPPKYPNARTVFSWFPARNASWNLNTTELSHGELLFSRGEEAVRGILAFLKKHEDVDFLPQVTKPSDLERKWDDIILFAKKNGL